MATRIRLIALVATLACAGAWTAPAPPIIGDEGAGIDDLVREKTLVTIVLNDGARAVNYRIRELHEETLAVIDPSGDNTAFPLDSVREIRVQGPRIESRKTVRRETALTTDDRKLVDDAANRAFEIFTASRGNQAVRIQAAMALAASDHEKKPDAQAYLRDLMAVNDVPTAIVAAGMLWRIGEEPSAAAIEAGLVSGSRPARASAATLVGLTDNQKYLLDIRRMLKDPLVEIFPAAAKAIARLDDRDSLPALYDGLRSLDDAKGEACVFALTRLGGSDVRQQMLTMLPNARGNEWFRIVRVLYQLGDEEAGKHLRTTALQQPAYQRQAALLLIREGSIEAQQFLRGYLSKPQDPNIENLVYRGRVGLALFEAGDIQAKGIIQDVLNTSPNEIYARGRTGDTQYKENAVLNIQTTVLGDVGNAMDRNLLSLLGAPIQNPDARVAVRACIAAMQIANPEFGAREYEASL
jgi:HEAT repeat protein